MSLISPLTVTQKEARRPFSEISPGDLITVNLYNPSSCEFDQPCGARVKRMDSYNVWITVSGLDAPEPYRIGDNLVLDLNQIKDW